MPFNVSRHPMSTAHPDAAHAAPTTQGETIMALSLYSLFWNWRREVNAARAAAAEDDAPLGIG